ncbi:MAG: hypothetical protein JJ892_13965 [Balneola sp.]|nr:hypothetical protein [Balneola sp.]MBO6652289.1 hypothetical protein [Balneola sp.]MBO6712715.1 hypothetical protein [Balneola sp.]MBO6801377.1 hypothetical protein [Balneola sp.]MBO6870464.1 hypothetical protein [Balneola sp.]
MTGLIWYVQIVHYPSFRFLNEVNFAKFHKHHSVRTGIIVMPVMSIELATSGILAWIEGWTTVNAFGFYLVILIWLSTFFLSVPKHNALKHGKVDSLIDGLVTTNWFRTVLWSIKSGLSFWVLLEF